jgi:hypothetical protein
MQVARHVGWVASTIMAFIALCDDAMPSPAKLAGVITAAEALATDLLGWFVPIGLSYEAGWLHCGNFGVLIINSLWNNAPNKVLDVVEAMVRITMMRGAQSGGVVTYADAAKGDNSLRGIRTRVVNGKRTDLSKLVRNKLQSNERGLSRKMHQRFYAGHTRFATSSIASLEGTHPHQWSPGRTFTMHMFSPFDCEIGHQGKVTESIKFVENYICHNGDLDFFDIGGKTYDTPTIQDWLEHVLHVPMPATVDSAAIAGLIDLHRTAGVWALSVRFGFVLGVQRCRLLTKYPTMAEFEKTASVFAACMKNMAQEGMIDHSFDDLSTRQMLIDRIHIVLRSSPDQVRLGLVPFDMVRQFIESAVRAFFDNDLLHSTQLLLKNAKGSFGLFVSSSLDAHRQICVAARGQTICVAFYPKSGLVLWGSEQAAVKAAVGMYPPPSKSKVMPDLQQLGPAVRLDLDDLGGEVCLLDWGPGEFVTKPNQHQEKHSMLGGQVNMVLIQERPHKFGDLHQRLVPLEDNPLVLPLPHLISKDPVGSDLADIPRVIAKIQKDWRECSNMNRLTAFNFFRMLRARMMECTIGKASLQYDCTELERVDLLLTGCEVSLWVAEQFAADMSAVFPRLRVRTISANKILGLHGQDFPVHATGHHLGAWDLRGTLVLIVSHSGGTFSSLAVSNLLQSYTKNLFAMCSEWDTQVSKQIQGVSNKVLDTRVFTTDIGLRPSEPCSVSVVATHQLLTQIFQHCLLNVIPDENLRNAFGCKLMSQDLQELERLNQDNIAALEDIVGINVDGDRVGNDSTSHELRKAGAVWAQHVLEAPRSWIMIAVYVLVTVTLGYTPVTGLATHVGALSSESQACYITRAADALIYLFLPQLTMLLIRVFQRRPLLHRMVGRTIVIGDVPWVSQCAEAFLSKLFAVSYSNTGVTVLSGNPVDHLVHRHTHKVVRGTLVACGRPDGRLSALTSAESSVCLSVNQASSIQNLGVTCESITIGHNPFKLPLTAQHICIKGNRPDFLCERLLKEKEGVLTKQSSSTLLGAFSNMRCSGRQVKVPETVEEKLAEFLADNKLKKRKELRSIFKSVDANGDGSLSLEEFIDLFSRAGSELSATKLSKVFNDMDMDGNGTLDYNEFESIMEKDVEQVIRMLGTKRGQIHGLANIHASTEKYLGEDARSLAGDGVDLFKLAETQRHVMQLYESRTASMQRFVAFCVMFHEIGKRVQDFWSTVSLGLLGYKMERTHSIMRIATTASPISGAEVRDRMCHISVRTEWDSIVHRLRKALRLNQLRVQMRKDILQSVGVSRKGETVKNKSFSSPTAESQQLRVSTAERRFRPRIIQTIEHVPEVAPEPNSPTQLELSIESEVEDLQE